MAITKTVTLEGGWNADFTGRDPAANRTTISPADPLRAVVQIAGTYGDWAAVAPTLDGFTITGARSDNHGGGLRMNDSNALVRNNVITGNVAFLLGGGVWVQRGAPRIGRVYDFELNTVAARKVIGQVVNHSGWTFRPMLWWFQTSHRGSRLLQALTPGPMQRWSPRRFWGVLYPATYFLGLGYLLAIGLPLDRHNLLVILLVSALWWGIWGFLAWALLGFPAFWRKEKQHVKA